MPVPPKPAGQRQRRNKRDLGVVEVVTGELVDSVAIPPAGDWLPETCNSWAALWKSQAASVLAEHHRPALDRLFMWRDKLAREQKNAARFRELADLEPFITGSQGQPKLNPMYDLADKAEQRSLAIETAIRSLEDRFPMTPAAELKLGVRFQQRQGLEALNARMWGVDASSAEVDPRALPGDTSVNAS